MAAAAAAWNPQADIRCIGAGVVGGGGCAISPPIPPM
eukprot:CAMPEP_0204530838 /NCGR_PEP_ID=MMETSP0661-20131031/10840_1 /ASSEMBLY_ACC=CAM_ASM_000606 /TAXON_ID=109239 /ORGANISM="Alexandrium margalefi, Strain AMGDE01CS-322" /LENGTH=36 /DNA_ID= /DNA_START= /DNA_END= /DNA_ORIENTATION=